MLLGQKRNFSHENDNEIEDINDPLIEHISFYNYHINNLNLEDNSQIEITKKNYKIPSVRQPQEIMPKENMCFYYISPKFDTLCIQDISMNSLLKLFPNRLINIVLDLDQTLIHSKPIESFDKNSKKLITNESYTIKGIINDNKFSVYFNFRPFFREFISSLKQFSTFYIFTLSHQNYANQIIDKIKNITGIEIKEDRIVSMKNQEEAIHFQKSLNYYKDITINNTIIIDDSAVKWDFNNLPNLILSKRYMSFFDEDGLGYHYIVEEKPPQHNISFYDDPIYKVPIFLENELSKRFQLKYLLTFIENSYKLSLIRNEEIIHCYQRLRRRILNKRFINFTYFGIATEVGFLKEIVKFLGGEITLDKGATTHFIISQGNISLFKSKCLPEIKNKKFYCVNVKWLFYTYFCLTKMNEQQEDLKVII